jgi:hypothetical protein
VGQKNCTSELGAEEMRTNNVSKKVDFVDFTPFLKESSSNGRFII